MERRRHRRNAQARAQAQAASAANILWVVLAASLILLAGAVFFGAARAACVDEVARVEEKIRAGTANVVQGAPADHNGADPAQPNSPPPQAAGKADVPVPKADGNKQTLDDVPTAALPRDAWQGHTQSDKALLARLESARALARNGNEAGCMEEVRSVKVGVGLLAPEDDDPYKPEK